MRKKISIRSNFIYNIIYEVFKIAVPLLTTPYIARVLGSQGVGTFSLAQTYALYFAMFASFGFASYAARELAYVRDDEDKTRELFWEIFLVKLIFSAIAIVGYYIFVSFFFYENDISYRIYGVYLLEILLDTSYYFTAKEHFKTVVFRNIGVKIFSLACIFAFVKQENQVWLYTAIIVLAGVLGQVFVFLNLDKGLFKKTTINVKAILKHIKGAGALFIPTIAIQVYTLLDKAMLGSICGESVTGYYENSQKMIRLASTAASAIVSVSVPRMAYTYANGKIDDVKKHFTKVFGFVTFLSFPICFGLIAIAGNFSDWYYGLNFVGIDKLVAVGSPLIISLGWSGIMGNMVLVSTGNQKYFSYAVYIGALINVCLNFVLIRPYGAYGALIASLAAEFTGMIIMFYFTNKLLSIANVLKIVPRYLMVSILMGICVKCIDMLTSSSVISTIIEVVIGSVIYFGILLIMRDSNVQEILSTIRSYINIIFKRLR